MIAGAAIARGRGSRGFIVLVAAGLLASYVAGVSVAVAATGGPRRALAGLFTSAGEGAP